MPPLRRSTRAVKRVSYVEALGSSLDGSESEGKTQRKTPNRRKKEDSDMESDYNMSQDDSSSDSSQSSSGITGEARSGRHETFAYDSEASDVYRRRPKSRVINTSEGRHPIQKLPPFPVDLLSMEESEMASSVRSFLSTVSGSQGSIYHLAEARKRHSNDLVESDRKRLEWETTGVLLDYLSRKGSREVSALTQTICREVSRESLQSYYEKLVSVANDLISHSIGSKRDGDIDAEVAEYFPAWTESVPSRQAYIE